MGVFVDSAWAGRQRESQFPKPTDEVPYERQESFEQSYLTAWLSTVTGIVIRFSPMRGAKLLDPHAGTSDRLAFVPKKRDRSFLCKNIICDLPSR